VYVYFIVPLVFRKLRVLQSAAGFWSTCFLLSFFMLLYTDKLANMAVVASHFLSNLVNAVIDYPLLKGRMSLHFHVQLYRGARSLR
jgi:hypothetical protein